MSAVACKGFTLIELLVTVAIIATLAAIALPSYREFLLRGYQSEARNGLVAAAAALERCYSKAYTYVDCTVSPSTETGLYSLSLDPDSLGPSTYLIIATRQASQVLDDSRCGDFTLDAAGNRGNTNAEESCW